MIKKKVGFIAASALVVGLVGCNNNDGAFDENRLSTRDVQNVNDNGNHTYGPFARQIDTRETMPNGLDDDRRFGTINDDNNLDFVPDDSLTNGDLDGMTISSSKTDLSSKNYPHTKAIVVQEAKYKFVANNAGDAKQRANQFIEQQKQQGTQRAQQLAQQHQKSQMQIQEKAQQNKQEQQEAKQQAKANEQQAPTQQAQEPAQPKQEQQAPAPAPKQEQNQAEKQPETQQPAQNMNEAVQQVIELTNQQRRKNGLPDLQADTQINGVAQKKSEDMRQNNYFSHTSPTYGSPFDMMRDFGVTYKTAGENIAQGQQTPQQVVEAWMNSEGHRKNILSKDFTHIGVGYDKNGHHWTQMFVGR
ncbi:putative YkwD family protein [Metabacillus crassostreae]|uniref:CAP domain-containing protein n=1 Tax=Metabacillus crassostreae TaxID=929098 RepID=UPI001EF8D367|nr:CAP domain-containing protein [Metabacillus crassostreae]MBM7604552.1 putative YkwD family protein [Metabacillus crassostreae]